MVLATALDTAFLKLQPGLSPSADTAIQIEKAVLDYYRRRPSPSPMADTRMLAPSLTPPDWLAAVDRRIQRSIRYGDDEAQNLYRLSSNVANAALSFFETFADLLPGEPYLYPSLEGDLVAEFCGAHGSLTTVVSPRFVILFANVDGTPVQTTINFPWDTMAASRREVDKLTTKLRTGIYGPVDAR